MTVDPKRVYTNPETGEVIARTFDNVRRGRIPWSDLDDEEVARLQLRDRNGEFSGMKPAIIPRELVQAHTRELLSRNDKLMREVVMKATAVFVDVIDSSSASDGDKMRAAQYLHDRILGKTPEKVELKAELKPWEGVVSEIGIITE